jgi:hypothetical protein
LFSAFERRQNTGNSYTKYDNAGFTATTPEDMGAVQACGADIIRRHFKHPFLMHQSLHSLVLLGAFG